MQIILRFVQVRDRELGPVDPRKVAICHGQSIQDDTATRGLLLRPGTPNGLEMSRPASQG